MEHLQWNAAGETILHSGNPNEDEQDVKGVGLILSRAAADSLLEWEPVSEQIITARFASKCQIMSIIHVYM